ncbi:hypothetical protein [Streptomyces sp. WG7]|uniref:hypothetical protein n=1 Tax=Streptomyces sp. WG7 TaxID=3417650 RepID=UPI003CF7C4E0
MRFTSPNSGWEFRPKVNRFLERGSRAPAHRSVTLPHDAVIESERHSRVGGTPESGGATNFLLNGVIEYPAVGVVYRDLRASETDLACPEVGITDSDCMPRRRADRPVTVEITGPGVLQSLGFGRPATEETFAGCTHTTNDGRALAVVRPTKTGRSR